MMLVQEQLATGHIEHTNSPLNSSSFVIKEKLGKWRLLQDLRAINKVMLPLGPFQPGLPSPVAIPSDYLKIVIDLKDCLFTIPLHPEDKPHFAFSVPQVNFQGARPHYQWNVFVSGRGQQPHLMPKNLLLLLLILLEKSGLLLTFFIIWMTLFLLLPSRSFFPCAWVI